MILPLMLALATLPSDVDVVVRRSDNFAEGADCRSKWSLANSLVKSLATLGTDAEGAVPLLTRLADQPANCFADRIRPTANAALVAIRANSPGGRGAD